MILFLDIDGVLNTSAAYEKVGKLVQPLPKATLMRLLLPEKVALVNQLAETLKASIVISSNWRFPSKVGGLNVKDLLIEAGITAPIIGDTGPDWDADHPHFGRIFFSPTFDSRFREIKRYIEQHGVVDYVVIDDDYAVQKFPQDRVIRPVNGILPEHVSRILRGVTL